MPTKMRRKTYGISREEYHEDLGISRLRLQSSIDSIERFRSKPKRNDAPANKLRAKMLLTENYVVSKHDFSFLEKIIDTSKTLNCDVHVIPSRTKANMEGSNGNKTFYPPYLVDPVLSKGVESGKYVIGVFRASSSGETVGQVVAQADENKKFEIFSLRHRNRALDLDLVAVKVLTEYEIRNYNETLDVQHLNQDKFKKKRLKSDGKRIYAKVVAIVENRHCGIFVGILLPSDKDDPEDSPAVCILGNSLNCGALLDLSSTIDASLIEKQNYYVFKLTSWSDDSRLPLVRIVKSFEIAKDNEKINLQIETALILTEMNLFQHLESGEADSVLDPNEAAALTHESFKSWEPTEEECVGRRDFRSDEYLVVSVDPPDSRDMDDAVSYRELSQKRQYEVGVHIADVSYYVQTNDQNDTRASRLCTSIYMVQRAYPMLPLELSSYKCSLNAGLTRLTVSVVWKYSNDGTLLDTWIGRSVIRSASKLSYEHAQVMIDNENVISEELVNQNCPRSSIKIHSPHTLAKVQMMIRKLWSLAEVMRTNRFLSGSLKYSNNETKILLDSSGAPFKHCPYITGPSQWMIEELMIAANIAVAERIFSQQPHLALLRRHVVNLSPEFCQLMQGFNFKISTESPTLLRNSINEFLNLYENIDEKSAASVFLLRNSCPAEYISTSDVISKVLKDEKVSTENISMLTEFARSHPHLFHHFALNVDLYTHFTSPIRRYPDILVHRQLLAILEGGGNDNHSVHIPNSLHTLSLCNEMKGIAKRCGDKSVCLYIKYLLLHQGPMVVKGLVFPLVQKSSNRSEISDPFLFSPTDAASETDEEMERQQPSNASSNKLTVYVPTLRLFIPQSQCSKLASNSKIFSQVSVRMDCELKNRTQKITVGSKQKTFKIPYSTITFEILHDKIET